MCTVTCERFFRFCIGSSLLFIFTSVASICYSRKTKVKLSNRQQHISNRDLTVMEQEKREPGLKFVNRPDDITLDDDPNIKRIEMSCGHAVSPESLTAFCRSLLDEGQYKFLCPALKDGTTKKCGAEWKYMEVRRIAVLSQEEQSCFEETMAQLAAAKYCEYNQCPSCKSYVEREDLTNLSVHCTICTAETGERYEFCWQCMKTWKGPAPRSDKCDNGGCVNHKLEKLLKCHDTFLPEVDNLICPSLRACPTCGNLVEHDTTGCKNIICNRCHFEFCFSCLKLTADCLKTSSYFIACLNGVAPRQTSIPTWKK